MTTKRETIVKAEIKETKSGGLQITLFTDELQREDLVIELGKTPRGIFSTVVIVKDEVDHFGEKLQF